ncbi:TPA: SgrR family transcriptional regulator, partial [Listeria monocytogenes]
DIHLVPKIITHKEASYSTMPEDETDMMMMGEIPSSDGEVAYLDFLNNPFLLPQHLLAAETLAEITTRLEKMKLEKDVVKRDALRTNIDRWLTEN